MRRAVAAADAQDVGWHFDGMPSRLRDARDSDARERHLGLA